MNLGARFGMVVCIALTGAAGFGIGGLVGPVLFMLVDIPLRLTPHEPPFQWIEPMMWTGFGCAVLGACAGGFVASRRLRHGPGV